MGLESTEVKVMQVNYICDHCEWGKMRCIGSQGSKHHHQCENKNCNTQVILDTVYPHFNYVPVEEPV